MRTFLYAAGAGGGKLVEVLGNQKRHGGHGAGDPPRTVTFQSGVLVIAGEDHFRVTFGPASTSFFASARPSPVISRTTLMTLIFLSPLFVSSTVNSVCSAAGAAAAAPAPPAIGAIATAAGAALTPHFSSRALMRFATSI